MPTCDEIREEFSALLDEELDIETRDTVEAHLCGCSECLRELHTLKRASDFYRAQSRVCAPEDFQEQVMAALRPRMGRRGALARFARPGPLLAMAATLMMVTGTALVLWRSAAPFSGTAALTQLSQVRSAPAPSRFADEAAAVMEAEAPVGGSMSGRERQEYAPESAPRPLAATAADPEPVAMDDLASGAEMAMAPPPASPPPPARAEPETILPPAPDAASAEATAEATATADSVTLGDRHFVLQGTVWQEAHYAGEPVTTLEAGTDAYNTLLRDFPALNEAATLGPEVIVQAEETWYLLRKPQ